MGISRVKVLFFAEGSTLAHVVRPFALARELDQEQFEVTFCRPASYRWLTADAMFPVVDLRVQDASVFARRLEHGSPLYDTPTLKSYVEDDLALIDDMRPDVIVGDFRLSLSVSARLRSVPYIALCDAYWSPERRLDPPLPVLGFTRFMPIPVAEMLFRAVSGVALKLHAMPMERLRAEHGMQSFGHDLRCCYSDADLRLFANFSALFPEVETGAHAAFINPVTWFPESRETPAFIEGKEPLIYVTMGSSGNVSVLEKVVPVLEATGSRVVIATAGKALPFKPASRQTAVFDYLPGNAVCRRAKLVVCNGGSPTTSQALVHGVPVLGIARNMDQFLNMRTIESYGAGLLVRADRASSGRLGQAVDRLLREPEFGRRATELANSLSPESGSATLARHLLSRAGRFPSA